MSARSGRLQAVEKQPEPQASEGSGGNGSGGDYGERLVRIETKLEYLATQTDIADLKALIANKETTQTRWLVGVVLAALGAVVTALIRTFN